MQTIDDHDFLRGLFFGETVKYSTHGFSKHNAICIVLTRRAGVQVGNGGGFDVGQNALDFIILIIGVSAMFEIGKCTLDWNYIVAMGGAFYIRNTRSHDTFCHDYPQNQRKG